MDLELLEQDLDFLADVDPMRLLSTFADQDAGASGGATGSFAYDSLGFESRTAMSPLNEMRALVLDNRQEAGSGNNTSTSTSSHAAQAQARTLAHAVAALAQIELQAQAYAQAHARAHRG